MIVMSIIIIIAISFFMANLINLKKSYDGKRKTDLYTVSQALEEFEADKSRYPTSLTEASFTSYLPSVPQDPRVGAGHPDYLYEPQGVASPKWYRLYAELENTGDPDIARLGCGGGCGPPPGYSYYTASANAPAP